MILSKMELPQSTSTPPEKKLDEPPHSESRHVLSVTRHPYVILTGNPNSGKTTLFNALTGLRAKVGNLSLIHI